VSVQSVPAAKPDQPQDLQINLGLQNVDLAELIQRLGVTVPFKLAGRLTFRVQATVPLGDVRDLKAYRFHGTVNLPWAQVEDLRLEQVQARAVYEQGVLRLEELSARVPDAAPPGGGTLRGSAELGLVPAGDLTARLTVAALPVGQLLRALPNLQADGGGTADGDVQLRAPAAALKDITRWEATGRLTGKQLRAFGRSAEELDFRLKLDRGTLAVTEARGRLNGATVSGTGNLRVTDPYPYDARVDLPPSEGRAWQQVVPEVRSVRLDGQARATADARGTLRPLTVQASGTAQVDGLAVNAFHVGTLRFRWDADTDRLRLTDFAAGLYGGDLTGSATVPLKPAAAGRVDLRLSRLNTTDLSKDVPQTPVRLEGTAEGSVAVNIPAAGPTGERAITADVRLEAQGLRVQNIPTDKLHAEVKYENGVATYSLKGNALGGEFDLSGQYPSKPATPAPPAPPPGQQGRLRVTGIDLGRLAAALRIAALRPLGGRFDLAADFQPVDGDVTGAGRFTVSNLSWSDQTVMETLTGDVQVGGGAVRIPEVAGRLAGGELRTRLTYDYRRPERSVLIVTVQRADARRLLAPFTDSPPLDGPLDARLVSRLGREWTGSGHVLLTYGKLFGVTVRDARFPLGWGFTPGGAGQLRLSDASAQASRGRLTGRAELAWGGDTRLNGQARFTAVDLGEFLSHYSDTHVAGGLATGRIDFGGRGLRSARDVNARVEATLAQATAMQLPVLRQLVPFILPGPGANALFSSGDLRGTLGGGVFRLERLSLVGQYARIFAEGTVTLEERLNLAVVANTQQFGIDPRMLRLLNLSLPAVGPVPLAVINEASDYLSNRTIRLSVTGTIRAPSIRVNPLPALSEAAVRFFLNQTNLPIPIPLRARAMPGP
jgi:hypothetical protein